MRELQTLLEGGAFFEGPRWHDGRWWVSDFYRHGVFTVDDRRRRREQVTEVASQPSGLGWLPDGTLLVVAMKDRQVLLGVGADGTTEVHADLSDLAQPRTAQRHGRVHRRPRLRRRRVRLRPHGAGQDPQPSPVYPRRPRRTLRRVAAEGLHFPNGSVITPDGSTLIVGETMGCRYTAFTIGDDGSLSDRRVHAQIAPDPADGAGFAQTLGAVTVGPDGCGLDDEGHIWAADGNHRALG